MSALARELSLPAFSYAFQPIWDAARRRVAAAEALVRGPRGEPAFSVLQQVPEARRYEFDSVSRCAALALAARLRLPCDVNLNFLPRGLEERPQSLDETLDAARRHGIALARLVIEVTEGEVIADHAAFARRINDYRALGVKVAIDDFGAGYSGLNLLAEFQPDQVKIDMNLVRQIERHGPRQAIVRAIVQVCTDLGIDVIAEGVETATEQQWFEDAGVRLFQGYRFARPAFEALPPVDNV